MVYAELMITLHSGFNNTLVRSKILQFNTMPPLRGKNALKINVGKSTITKCFHDFKFYLTFLCLFLHFYIYRSLEDLLLLHIFLLFYMHKLMDQLLS